MILDRINSFLPIGGILFMGAFLSAGLSAQESPKPPSPAEDFHLLFFGPEAPHFVCLQIHLDKSSPQQVRKSLLEEIFKQTDTTQDGKLDSEELKTVGGEGRMRSVVQTLINAESNDLDLEKFFELINPTLGIPFGMQTSSERISDLVNLFQKLDLDQNQYLTDEEWLAAPELLHRFDYDDDETLNLVEVMPLLRPLNIGQSATVSAGAQAGLFWLLNESSQTSQLAQQILAQYDGIETKNSRGSRSSEQPLTDGQLTAKELGWSDRLLSEYDLNQDDRMSQTELEQMLKSPPAQHVWRIRMPLQKKLTVRVWRARNPEEKWQFPRSATSRAKFRLGQSEFEIQARNSRTQFSDVLTFAQLQFLQADANKDSQISNDEFQMLRLPFSFENVDRDRNEMISREEVKTVIQQTSALSQSQVAMKVDQQSESLFRLLDTDQDRRLEPRELMNAGEKMSVFDKNDDGQLTPTEMKSVYKLTFSLEPPTLFLGQMGINLADRIQPIITENLAGPEWFRKMDRNLDGDLTPREFIGPTSLFVQFDLDQDGLLDPKEAEKIQPE